MKSLDFTGIAYLGALALIAYAIWRASRAAPAAIKTVTDTVKGAASAINPANPDNIFATGANAAGAVITGDPNWTLGGGYYDRVNPVQYDPNRTKPPIMGGISEGMALYSDQQWLDALVSRGLADPARIDRVQVYDSMITAGGQ